MQTRMNIAAEGQSPALADRLVMSWERRAMYLARIAMCIRHLGVAGFQAAAIPTFTLPGELAMLHSLARSCPAAPRILEIGSYLGASTCFLAAAAAELHGTLFCVDTWQNQTMPDGERDTFNVFRRNTAPFSERIRTIRRRSSELSDNDLELPLNLAFIDGDHSFAAVLADFERVAPWIAPGGVIAFHDCSRHFPGVPRTVGHALHSGDWLLGGIVETLCWIVRRS
jgi:predicted O-methyltransferase YrrM